MPKRLHSFESLCLSHCKIDIDALKQLCAGFYRQTTIKYLDLSWNNIKAEGMKHILAMLAENKSLTKLYIQHNYLGEEGAKQMVKALRLHPEMKYLDISANQIGSAGFIYFIDLFKEDHTLENLHVRKNQINGEEILDFPKSLEKNSNLFYLDMKDNMLDNQIAERLINLLHTNYFIEDLVLEGNHYISQTNKETIEEECRKNLLIKEFILPHLLCNDGNFLKDNLEPAIYESHFKNYNVETLSLEDKSFFRSDFIAKFIDMNKNDFHSLELRRVHFDEHIKDLADFLKNCKTTKLQSITLEDCDIGDSQI